MFLISIVLTLSVVAWGLISPLSFDSIVEAAFSFIIGNFGWFYLMTVSVFLVFSIWLGFSRFGKVRLGPPDSRPEFNYVSWFAMLFAAGMGIGLVFWGVAEPLYHYIQPRTAIPRSPESAAFAIRASFFHWGLHPWATYSVMALALAYFQFRRNRPALISEVFRPLLGERVQGPIGKSIDTLAIVATVTGVATSLGLGTLQINSGLNYLFGISIGTTSQVVIILVVTLLFMTSALTGLEKGIKLLSNLNLGLAGLLLTLAIILGPTVVVFETLTTGIGNYFNNIVRDSLNINSFGDISWLGSWTLFYWAWWIAWAPFVGSFIARISRGRTIREFTVGVLLVPTLASFIWFATFGAAGIYLDINGIASVGDAAIANVSTAFFEVFKHYPLGSVLSVAAIILVSVFFITSADSATYVLGIMSSGGDRNPSTQKKLLWGIVQSVLAVVLLISGGLNTLQIAAIAAAFPFSIIMLFICVSLWKALHQDEQKTPKPKA